MIPHPLHLLWFEADDALFTQASAALEGAGCAARRVADADSLRAELAAGLPHVLLLDFDRHAAESAEICRWVRDQHAPHYVYVLLVARRDEPANILTGMEAGADDYLGKPLDDCELLGRMCAAKRMLELENRWSLMARCDPLTGLYTQRAFFDALRREWARAPAAQPLSCVMMDLDFFKRINDTLGHAAGDRVIRQTAILLLENCRSGEFVSRYGGEEFSVLLPHTDERQAEEWADEMRARLREAPIPVGTETLRVTASFGVAQRLDDLADPEKLVDLADQALLVAKRSGRDRVVRFQSLTRSLADAASAADNYGGLRARDVMSPLVTTLRDTASLGQAANYFLQFRAYFAPVVSADGALTGILSEKDLMSAMLANNWRERAVREVMRGNAVWYEENTPVQVIFEFLSRVSLKGVIIAREGRPVGMVTRGHLFRWRLNAQEARREAVEEHSFPDLLQVVDSLCAQTAALHDHVRRRREDLLPYVVGDASRLQELVEDLLAQSRCLAGGNASSGHDGRDARVGLHTLADWTRQ